MWEKLKSGYRQFRDDESGVRFLNAHQRWRSKSKGPAATILIITTGAIFIVGGLFLGLVPGAPGIVLGLVGFALIAARFRRMAIWLDWCEVKIRRAWRSCRRAAAH